MNWELAGWVAVNLLAAACLFCGLGFVFWLLLGIRR